MDIEHDKHKYQIIKDQAVNDKGKKKIDLELEREKDANDKEQHEEFYNVEDVVEENKDEA